MTDVIAIVPVDGPLDAEVRVPGSKSLTNRALVLASLAEGTSTLAGALVADDTEAMAAALSQLGAEIVLDRVLTTVSGVGGRLRPGPLEIDARLSGTTARFVLPVLTLGDGPYVLDGAEPLRDRPMGPTIEALRRLGAEVDDTHRPGHLPVVVRAGEVRGDGVGVDGELSSQFTSGLLLAAAAMPAGLAVDLLGPVVSRPYLDMTVAVLRAFGVDAGSDGERRLWVQPGGLRATDYTIEPDASAASYFLAAAAICGGRVRVPDLGAASLQGDARFADTLAAMGAAVHQDAGSTEVRGSRRLRGIDVDLTDMPDMAQTLAAVAVFADGPTRVRGVEVIRGHETDRIAAVVTELRRCGIDAHEHHDGFTIHPGTPQPSRVETYRDHRMAMSFALLGLRAPGIAIADPGCVAKTFPDFFDHLDRLRLTAGGAAS
jgi:3-phosphoshikimate 1-carboxyvinyltransferase